MKTKGILTLELLLIAATILSILTILTPATFIIIDKGKLALDIRNIELVLEQIKNNSENLKYLGTGSKFTIKTMTYYPWKITINGNNIVATIQSKQEETIETEISQNLSGDLELIKGLNQIILEKNGENILISNN